MHRALEITGVGLALGLYLFLFVGLVLRHVPGGEVLGRYTGLYLFALVALGLGIVPFGVFVHSLFRESRARIESGREIVLAPGRKLALAGAAMTLLLVPLEIVLWRSATRRTDHDMQKFHPFLQIQGRPDRASRHHNSHGFRGDEIELERSGGDDATRIFFLGGSTVYCLRVPFEKTHVRQLELRLRERFPARRFEVQNAGMEWYTTAHSLVNYQLRVKDYRPDVVILYHGINDLLRSFAPAHLAFGAPRPDYGHYYGPIARLAFGRHGKAPIPTPHLLDWMLEPGRLYSDLDRTTPTRVDHFPSLAPFERNLRSLADATVADGVRLVLATQPYLYRDDLTPEEAGTLWMAERLGAGSGAGKGVHPDRESMARGMAAFNAATRRVAHERGVPWIELAEAVPKDLTHFVDGVHYTEAGNERVAEAVFEGLLAGGLP
jgi:lysophospholipase L1-like esterase